MQGASDIHLLEHFREGDEFMDTAVMVLVYNQKNPTHGEHGNKFNLIGIMFRVARRGLICGTWGPQRTKSR